MTQLPTFDVDKLWSEVSASKMRNLVDDVKRLRNLSVGPGLRLTSNNSALHISLEPTSSRAPVLDVATVAVVGFADGADAALTVHTTKQDSDNLLMIQFVDHLSIPPVPDELTLFGEPFPAHPAIGVKLAAFANSVTTGTPTIDSAFFTARRRSTIWFVDGPGGGGGTTIAQYKFVGFMGIGGTGFSLDTPTSPKSFHDAFRCHQYKSDGAALVMGDDGTPTEFLVMLPYLLRGGPFDGDGLGSPRAGITYTNVSAQSRIATRQDAGGGLQLNEQEVITPAYLPNDRIFAVPASAFHPLSSEKATLLDKNVDSRAWTRRRGQ